MALKQDSAFNRTYANPDDPTFVGSSYASAADRKAANQARYTDTPVKQRDGKYYSFWVLRPLDQCFLADGTTPATNRGTWGTLDAHWVQLIDATMLAAAIAAITPATTSAAGRGTYLVQAAGAQTVTIAGATSVLAVGLVQNDKQVQWLHDSFYSVSGNVVTLGASSPSGQALAAGDKIHYLYTTAPVQAGAATQNALDLVRTTLRLKPITQNYTLALDDAGCVLLVTATGDVVISIPENASVPFPVGTLVFVRRRGSGKVTVAGISNNVLPIVPTDAGLNVDLGSELSLHKEDINTFYVKGGIS